MNYRMLLRGLIIVCILYFVCCMRTFAQTSFVSCGNSVNVGGEISFSVGQVVVFETESDDFLLIAGVQQPFSSLSSDVEYTVVSDSGNGVQLYPCPVKTTLNVVCEDNDYTTLLLYNTAGALVVSMKISAQQTSVDMSRLSSGLYYVQLLGDARNEFFKIIKE